MNMSNDHNPTGWSRRSLLLAGAGVFTAMKSVAIAGTSLATAEPHCVLSTELTEGPYYIDNQIMRRNITEGRPGIPLKLRVIIVDAKRCMPVENAALDIWHCDASGVYSGFAAQANGGGSGFGPPPGGFGPPLGGGRPDFGPGGPPPGGPRGPGGPGGPGGMRKPTDKSTFFRGVQVSDRNGVAEIETIYPGWYQGRDTHIHVRVHVGGSGTQAKYQGGHIAHTGQLFFPDDLTDKIATLQPYAASHIRRVRNEEDGIFLSDHSGGSIVTLENLKKGSLSEGFIATAVLGIDPTATPAPAGFGGGPGGPPMQRRPDQD